MSIERLENFQEKVTKYYKENIKEGVVMDKKEDIFKAGISSGRASSPLSNSKIILKTSQMAELGSEIAQPDDEPLELEAESLPSVSDISEQKLKRTMSHE